MNPLAFLWRLLSAFVGRLKRVPNGTISALRRLIAKLFGQFEIPPNPYIEQVRELQARGNVTADDVERVVLPLLLIRDDRDKVLSREVRHSVARGTVLYAFVVVLLIFVAAFVGQVRDLTHDNQTALHRLDDQAKQIRAQQHDAEESRRIGRATNCAIQSSVIKAAIVTIKQSTKLPPALNRNLVRLGYPNEAQRRAQANRTARAYALLISRAVEKAARAASPTTSPARAPVKVGTIVKKDGTLDCRKLAALSVADPRAQSGP